MAESVSDSGAGQTALRIARSAAAVIILLVVAARFFTILIDYNTSGETAENGAAVESTETPEPGEDVAETGTDEQGATEREGETEETTVAKVVVVIIPGLNFRTEPKSSANVMRSLPEGTRLTLVAEQSGWYQVRDEDGTTGWVSSSPQYVRVEDAGSE